MSRIAELPFLYEPLVGDLIGPHTARTTLLTGGVGTGKTTVIERVAEQFGTSAVLVRGGAGKEPALPAIRAAIDADQPLLIDDVDEIFDLDVAETLRPLEKQTRRQTTVMTSSLPSDLSALMEGSAFSDVNWNKEAVTEWSRVTMTFATRSIDPWPDGWHRRLIEMVTRATGESKKSGWATAVLHVTGGHPVLLHEALNVLEVEKRRRGAQTLDGDVPAAEWQRRVLMLEDEIFPTGFRRLRRGLLKLEQRDPQTREALRRLAQGEGEAQLQGSPATRRAILLSGVIYRTASQPFVIAGETLRRYLSGSSETLQPAIEVVAEDANRGYLAVTIGNERYTVPLRSASWRLLRVLGQKKSDFVTLPELQKKAEIEATAIRSAIQRLKAEIQRGGFDDVIENVWGAGYRLGSFPTMVPERFND
ncbi:MAG TPA: helix-turn-helix domain-containing protein [Thermoanaerobaculia bacterium]|nr:helix-turn-helix domain-containing protein [Thermoanaerobaculia bacterium]